MPGTNANPPRCIDAPIRPPKDWELGFDLQRTFWGDIRSLHKGVLNSLQDPPNQPLASKDGSGFNWGDRNSNRAGVACAAAQRLALRAGATCGRRASADSSADSIGFMLFAPNPLWQVTAGVPGGWMLATRCICRSDTT